MNLESFLATYGCLAVAMGAFLEGETMLLLGGLAAQHGQVALGAVMVAGLLGGLAGDQLYFHLGRRYGTRMLANRPRWQGLAARGEAWLGGRRDLFIFSFRFLYGMRVVSPLVIGLSTVSVARYTLLNVAAGVVWAVTITLVGYGCGQGIETLLGTCQDSQLEVGGGIVCLVLLVWCIRRLVLRPAAAAASDPV